LDKPIKFAMSYSCGKDSALALYKTIQAGHRPVCIVVAFNKEAGRSWFHGVEEALLEKVSQALELPLIIARSHGDDYTELFENALRQVKTLGAEACVFGDIDIEGHLEWNRERCAAAGLECIMPLWGMSRTAAVSELLDAGFAAIIKSIDKKYLDESFLGLTLDKNVIKRVAATGADICGENGEYHTFVYDGPVFRHPVQIKLGEVIDLGTHAVIDIR